MARLFHTRTLTRLDIGGEMLTLRGVDFGSIFCGSGGMGFFGEGYWWHKYARILGMTWDGVSFVSKTVTYEYREGNTPLKENGTPRQLFPRSIVVKPLSGHMLNAVGLSNFGSDWALNQGYWQTRTEPFMISFMAVGETPENRLEEARQFSVRLRHHLPWFKAPIAIQANRACPNTGHPPDIYYEETVAVLEILGTVAVPVVVNYNPTVPLDVMKVTAEHEVCDALWIGNTIPWGDPRIDWHEIFGTTESPLAKRNLPVKGGGGLSGPACLPHTVHTIVEARSAGITKPIVGGNGINRPSDVRLVRNAGADAVAIAATAGLRPWRMRSIISAARKYDRS